jgi:hypothetical protein
MFVRRRLSSRTITDLSSRPDLRTFDAVVRVGRPTLWLCTFRPLSHEVQQRVGWLGAVALLVT